MKSLIQLGVKHYACMEEILDLFLKQISVKGILRDIKILYG